MAEMTEEEQKELQEKLKNMSPEELKEFQKKQCIFCHIISGKVQSKKIFEDDKTIAILDINPANPGHILLLPKEHYAVMPQLPEDELQHIFKIAKQMSNVILKGLGVDGTNIIVANGIAAGQKAQHFMIHIIPRQPKDGLTFELPQKKIEDKELDEISKKLSNKLTELTGVKLKESKVVEGDFKEKKEEPKKEEEKKTKEEPETKKEEKPETKKEPKPKKEPPKQEEKPDLDDISKLLGAK